MKIEYKGYIIESRSYKLVTSKRWRPKASLIRDVGDSTIVTPLLWGKEFSTKKEADTYAVVQTAQFLDRQE